MSIEGHRYSDEIEQLTFRLTPTVPMTWEVPTAEAWEARALAFFGESCDPDANGIPTPRDLTDAEAIALGSMAVVAQVHDERGFTFPIEIGPLAMYLRHRPATAMEIDRLAIATDLRSRVEVNPRGKLTLSLRATGDREIAGQPYSFLGALLVRRLRRVRAQP